MQLLQDRIRGCLLGGAAGDALGYPVEFMRLADIRDRYGADGITSYCPKSMYHGQAQISDDTQMTMFTANGILCAVTRERMTGNREALRFPLTLAYQDWYWTQQTVFYDKAKPTSFGQRISWLCDVKQLYSRRAPGNTCLSSLRHLVMDKPQITDYLTQPMNNSCGCGAVMRMAPLGMLPNADLRQLDLEAAQVAAITHGHPLGYLSAVALSHMIHRILFPICDGWTLKDIAIDTANALTELFAREPQTRIMTDLIHQAIALSENDRKDADNISELGEGWVGHEAFAVALYCSLRYEQDFSAGIIAAANHDGDTDSTAAIAGNILGAWLGLSNIEQKWQNNLELSEVILELADDLYHGLCDDTFDCTADEQWLKKYML